MNQTADTTPMNDDARMLAASAAARTERANRPTLLVIAACGALAAALVALGSSWSSYRGSVRSLEIQQAKSDRVAQRVAELLALRARSALGDQSAKSNDEVGQLLPRITEAAAKSGMKDLVQLPLKRRGPATPAGSQQIFLDYNVADESLPAMLSWIQRSMADVPGLELFKIVMSPEQHKWRMKVTFSRWEKMEGA